MYILYTVFNGLPHFKKSSNFFHIVEMFTEIGILQRLNISVSFQSNNKRKYLTYCHRLREIQSTLDGCIYSPYNLFSTLSLFCGDICDFFSFLGGKFPCTYPRKVITFWRYVSTRKFVTFKG